MKILVAPSLLSADFSCLDREIRRVESAGADLLHIDVMDGHFVPNLTIGPVVVKHIRKRTALPLDVHLMIEHPQRYIEAFVDAGSDMLTMHIETISAKNFKLEAKRLKDKGIRVGVSLNPATALSKIRPVLDVVDFVLVMSVNPGFGGQAFMPEVLPKIKKIRSLFDKDIAVDGGMNEKTAKLVVAAGANILAAGSYIFAAANAKQAIERMRRCNG
ncbi:MAG: ribulose-phosphate 3-epimerase [Candidatus Omnitrophica bacterium]|nr:ribulose-phosphate 3-epimerase [Candidatus Omnitrophota bacterium]